jgi:hypothetical protein
MLDPLTAEDELRGALGQQAPTVGETGFVAAARLAILIDLLAGLDLDDAVDDLLRQARATADEMLAEAPPDLAGAAAAGRMIES